MLRPRPKIAGIQRPEVRESPQKAMGLKGVGVPRKLRDGAEQAMTDIARSRAAVDKQVNPQAEF